MKRWGIIITAFYAAVLVFLVMPAVLLISMRYTSARELFGFLHEAYRVWDLWVWLALLIGGEALLLFLSVDTSWRRLQPRQHVAVTALLAGVLIALLAIGAIWSLAAGVYGEKIFEWHGLLQPWRGNNGGLFAGAALVWLGALWAIWGAVFYFYYRDVAAPLSRIVTWLLRGSVLELLIAVPAHILVRHRNDCSAPFVTGWGIVTGVAVMLLCFGPGVLALYQRKLDDYSR